MSDLVGKLEDRFSRNLAHVRSEVNHRFFNIFSTVVASGYNVGLARDIAMVFCP